MSDQTFTNDLRSNAKEFNRDKNSRVKWAHGEAYGPGRRVEDARPRPARVAPLSKGTVTSYHKTHSAIKNDIAYASAESSADEDVDEPSAAPAPDADITYSFDAEKGPSHGSQVFGQALAKAIERYEVRETDKLIKTEYEVLDFEGEALSPPPKKRHVAPEDEEYEFVDA